MKKIIIVFAFFSAPVIGLYNGNPEITLPSEGPMTSKESWMTIKAGYLGSNIFDRKMSGTKKFHFWMNGGLLAFDVFKRLSIYGYASAVRMKAEIQEYEYFTKNSLGGMVGVDGVLARKGSFTLGLSAKYFQTKGSVLSSPGGTILYREGQVGTALSYDVSRLSPYAGIKYSRASAQFSKPKKETLFNKNPVGVFFGFNLVAPKTFEMGFEADFIDEWAIALTIKARL